MFGVVLWCNVESRKAVIWCEDQGDLAYLDMRVSSGVPAPGDLVRMEFQMDADVRRVANCELIAERHAPSIASTLKLAVRPETATVRSSDAGACIIPFRPAAVKRSALSGQMAAESLVAM